MAKAKASPSLAQTLPSDAVLDALKVILPANLNDILTTITRLIQAHKPSRWRRSNRDWK
jgi:hypothetical protein